MSDVQFHPLPESGFNLTHNPQTSTPPPLQISSNIKEVIYFYGFYDYVLGHIFTILITLQILQQQLFDASLYRLYSTGAIRFVHKPEDDFDIDVSSK